MRRADRSLVEVADPDRARDVGHEVLDRVADVKRRLPIACRIQHEGVPGNFRFQLVERRCWRAGRHPAPCGGQDESVVEYIDLWEAKVQILRERLVTVLAINEHEGCVVGSAASAALRAFHVGVHDQSDDPAVGIDG